MKKPLFLLLIPALFLPACQPAPTTPTSTTKLLDKMHNRKDHAMYIRTMIKLATGMIEAQSKENELLNSWVK